jgi:hypothetical protein
MTFDSPKIVRTLPLTETLLPVFDLYRASKQDYRLFLDMRMPLFLKCS